MPKETEASKLVRRERERRIKIANAADMAAKLASVAAEEFPQSPSDATELPQSQDITDYWWVECWPQSKCRDAKMKDLLSQTSHDLKTRSDTPKFYWRWSFVIPKFLLVQKNLIEDTLWLDTRSHARLPIAKERERKNLPVAQLF